MHKTDPVVFMQRKTEREREREGDREGERGGNKWVNRGRRTTRLDKTKKKKLKDFTELRCYCYSGAVSQL